MKGLIAWLQATINNQRPFPMPEIWFRVSALAQGGILSSRLVVKYCEQGRDSQIIPFDPDTLMGSCIPTYTISSISNTLQ